MPDPVAGRGWMRVRRLMCRLSGHRIVFPEDIWAPLTCRRCDWTGPNAENPLVTVDRIIEEAKRSNRAQ
jgi:hypothetical protein